jgi:carbonic anhydrase/acetyltransferase-like protein (isoleucine patch superfamily)
MNQPRYQVVPVTQATLPDEGLRDIWNRIVAEGKVIPDGSLVIGSPGKVARKLTDEEIARINGTAGNYVKRFNRYQAELTADE